MTPISKLLGFGGVETSENNYTTKDGSMILSSKTPLFCQLISSLEGHDKINFEMLDLIHVDYENRNESEDEDKTRKSKLIRRLKGDSPNTDYFIETYKSTNPENGYEIYIRQLVSDGRNICPSLKILSLDEKLAKFANKRCTYNLHSEDSRVAFFLDSRLAQKAISQLKGRDEIEIASIAIKPGCGQQFAKLDPELGIIKGSTRQYVENIVNTYFNTVINKR